MADDAPDWDLYRSFLAVVDQGSLSGAARALRIAQPTVGRHIAALEGALGGAALFTRSPGGLRPTDAALALRPLLAAITAGGWTAAQTAAQQNQIGFALTGYAIAQALIFGIVTLLASLPPILIYAFLMDYYIAGLTAGATKG